MTYENVLDALSDPRRRNIFMSLKDKAQSVGELAEAQPVSRPAVSQHLKVLVAANLVEVEKVGVRRIYCVRQEGLEDLKAWLDEFWEDAFSGFESAVSNERDGEDG